MIPHSRPYLEEAEAKAVAEVIRSGRIAQGGQVAAFESAMAAVTGQEAGVAVSSGTAALHLALQGLGVGSGDEVIIPSYVCTALWHAIKRTDANPVVVDIDPGTYTIDPVKVLRGITSRTRAIVIPHMFGLAMDLTELARAVAQQGSGVSLIEDCAHTLGVTVKGTPVGGQGDLTICSFYATKLLSTGEGGMVLGKGPLMDRLRGLRVYDEQESLEAGFNYKMTDLQAAMGQCQVARLDAFLARRRRIAARYVEAVSQAGVAPPLVFPGREHGYYRFVVRLSRPLDPILQRADLLGIACRRPIYRPIHRYLGLSGFLGTDAAWEQALSIPLYPALTEEEVDRIVAALPALLAG